MALDDFTGDSLSEEERERRDKLSNNHPPSDEDDKWRHYEPGNPDWLSFISGQQAMKEDVTPKSMDNGKYELPEGSVLSIRIEGVKDTTLRSGNFVNLNKCR